MSLTRIFPLFVNSDASAVAVAYLTYQIIGGRIRLIDLCSKILQGGDRRRSPSFREALAIELRPVSPDSLRSGAPVHRDRFVSSFPTRE